MTATQRHYQYPRVRGLAPWSPRSKTLDLLAKVERVLAEYSTHLPLTLRQIFYRLVGNYGYSKTENAYNRLGECLNRARRAGLIAFDDIRDDGVTVKDPGGFSGKAGFWSAIQNAAHKYRLIRLTGQPVLVEIWVEAAGMVPQIEQVAYDYGIPVYSSGGFDSTTAKYEAAKRMVIMDRQTVVLHIGDHDPSGLSVFDSAAEDVESFVYDIDPGVHLPEFERVAVTEAQVQRYNLPTAPPKRTDDRGNWQGGTVQAEALPPDALAAEVRAAILNHIDEGIRRDTVEREERQRRELVEQIRGLSL